jgi:hypothetical protein
LEGRCLGFAPVKDPWELIMIKKIKIVFREFIWSITSKTFKETGVTAGEPVRELINPVNLQLIVTVI